MDYIIEYQSREQYDEYGNCKPKSHAKSFNENSTLGEIVEWVKETCGVWCGEYDTLTNPQIIGILKSREE